MTLPQKYYCATVVIFRWLTVTRSLTTHIEYIVAFLLQQWLCKRATILRYTYFLQYKGKAIPLQACTGP